MSCFVRKPNDRPAWFYTCSCAVVVLGLSTIAQAATIDVPAVQDTTTGTGSSATNTNFDGINGGGVFITDGTRPMFLQFDLSVIPAGSTITGAQLALYMVAASDTNATAWSIDAYSESDADGTQSFIDDTFTYAVYQGNGWPEVGPRALGSYPAPIGTTLNQYYFSTAADASDLTLLNSIYTAAQAPGGPDGNLILQLFASGVLGTHSRTFEDHENTNATGFVPKLIITYIPEPSSMLLAGMGLLLGTMFGIRKPK
jgi:hypothetical protein